MEFRPGQSGRHRAPGPRRNLRAQHAELLDDRRRRRVAGAALHPHRQPDAGPVGATAPPAAPIVRVDKMPVPQGTDCGEFTAPTQPYSAVSYAPDEPLRERDMWGGTPLDQMMCRIQFRQLRYEGDFPPPPEQGPLVYPGNVGTFNWPSVAVDPS